MYCGNCTGEELPACAMESACYRKVGNTCSLKTEAGNKVKMELNLFIPVSVAGNVKEHGGVECNPTGFLTASSTQESKCIKNLSDTIGIISVRRK